MLPSISDGARISLILCLILVTVGEIMLGATRGLGTRVNDSLSGFSLAEMYALILIIGFLGYLLIVIARICAERWADYVKYL